MNEPTTPHAPVTEEIIALCMKLSMERAYDPDGTDCQTLADYVAACTEQTRLNGCEAVRRSEEAAKVAAEITDTTIHELTQNMEALNAALNSEKSKREDEEIWWKRERDQSATIAALDAKLAAETARADAAEVFARKEHDGRKATP